MLQHLAANHEAGVTELAHIVPVMLAHMISDLLEVDIGLAHSTAKPLVHHPKRHNLILDNQMHCLFVRVLQMLH